MWKCLLTHTGNVDLLMLVCSVSLFAVTYQQAERNTVGAAMNCGGKAWSAACMRSDF